MSEEFQKTVANWNEVDWMMRDIDIAKQLGVSRQRVSQVRLSSHKPNSPLRKYSAEAVKIDSYFKNNKIDYKTTTVEELANAIGVQENCLRSYFKRNRISNKKFKSIKEKFAYRTWNWNLPNKVLRDIYGASITAICRLRKRVGKKTKFDLRVRGNKDSKKLMNLVDKEKQSIVVEN